MKRSHVLWLAACLLPGAVQAQTTSRPHGELSPAAYAAGTVEPIRIDGMLHESAWASAAAVTTFVQVDPSEGRPATHPTEVRILYDAEAIYFGVRLHDGGTATSRLGRRDMPLGDSDWFAVVLDSYHDHRTAFAFYLNPSGVRRDEIRVGETSDASWDPVWDGAVGTGESGWTAEYRIPFSQLRFRAGDDLVWGLQLERTIHRNGELAVFAFTPKKERGGIGSYGHLTGLKGLRPGKRLEVLPYTVADAQYVDPGANPYRSDAEYGVTGGLDVKYRLTSDLVLDGTFNPDFGQVEVDPAVVNLTAYETFFPEKRPFFIEGTEVFAFSGGSSDHSLFYSRRIGRRPQLFAPSPHADLPEATRILGAVKLSGKTAGGWSVGFLEALTERKGSRYRDLDGTDQTVTVEPRTNYFVGRARRDMRAGQTSIGAIFTAVNRDLDTDFLRDGLRAGAFSGGVDFRHEWARRSWALGGSVSMSRVTGSPEAILVSQIAPSRYYQRPDLGRARLDPSATALAGYAAELNLHKQAGAHWRGSLSLLAVSPGYEVNDLGFQSRADNLAVTGSVGYVENQPGRTLRSWRVTALGRVDGNYDGDQVGNKLFLGSNWLFLNYWSAALNLGYSFRSVDDRLTRGGPLAARPADGRIYLGVTTDPRRRMTGSAAAYYGADAAGGSSTAVSVGIGVRPSAQWNLSLGSLVSRTGTIAQYVTMVPDSFATGTYGARYVFAELDQTAVNLEARVNVTFTPALSLQLYAQPFVGAAAFGRPKELHVPGEFRFVAYGTDVGTLHADGSLYTVDPDGAAGPAAPFAVRDPDFNFRSLRGNAVLRWEWRPGSTVYLAWQQRRQARDSVGSFRLQRDGREMLNAQPDNVFVIKMSYWFNP